MSKIYKFDKVQCFNDVMVPRTRTMQNIKYEI